MATPLLIIVTLIYTYCGAQFLWEGNYAMAVMYIGYSIANLGLIWFAMHPPIIPK